MWDFLIVAVSTDDFNNEKGKKSAIPYKERAVIVEAIKYVDMVIPEYNWSQKKRDLIAFEAQMVMWDDWTGKFDEFDCIYLPRTPNISSTQIKNMLALKNWV